MRIATLAVLFLAGCANVPEPVPQPKEVIIKHVATYVPISEELTKRCPWPKGTKPSKAVEVAKKRAECLKQYEAQLEGIGRIQGTPAN